MDTATPPVTNQPTMLVAVPATVRPENRPSGGSRDQRAHRGRPGPGPTGVPDDPRDRKRPGRRGRGSRRRTNGRGGSPAPARCGPHGRAHARLDGIEATRQVARAPDCASKVVMLTTFDLDEYVYEGLLAGASGFLLKDV